MATCTKTGKRRYAHRDMAIGVAAELMARKRDPGHRPLNVYVCPDCDGWHVGHRPKVLAAPAVKAAQPAPAPSTARCDCHCKKRADEIVLTRHGISRYVCKHHAQILKAVYGVSA